METTNVCILGARYSDGHCLCFLFFLESTKQLRHVEITYVAHAVQVFTARVSVIIECPLYGHFHDLVNLILPT